jgi:Pyruvate/2-oxoacid:ferredoxin oxidoreductase delta subunit
MSDSEDREAPTREVLHFAAQGGMLPSRYRLSCQTCAQPVPSHADIHFEFLGLETGKHFILGIYTPSLEADLKLETWGEGKPSRAIDEARTRVLENIRTWRGRAAERLLASIPDECMSVAALDAHLMDCAACADHLGEWCPAFPHTALEGALEERRAALTDWLGACGGCGLCDHQCPAGFPLFETVFALGRVQ